MAQKNIVHIIVGLERGGAEIMLRRLIESRRLMGDDVKDCVISLTDLGFHGPAMRHQGIPVYVMNLRSPLGFVRVLIQLAVLLRRLKPEIVQTWMLHADLLGGIAAYLAGVRYVIWGVRSTDFSVESLPTRILRWFCARMSHHIPTKVVCAAHASMVASLQAGYASDKLMVISNGFDVDALRCSLGLGAVLRAKIGISFDSLVIGCMGRYHPAKDHANFVRAALLVAENYPQWVFLMVGRGLDSSNAELQGLVTGSPFEHRFVWMGERTDPAACLNAMDIFVLSSCTEGFPNVLGEAMAMGVPCVSTDVGDASILLGNAGELVPSRNSSALFAALDRVLQMSVSERNEMGEKGHLRVQQFFSIKNAGCIFEELYSSLAIKH